MNWIEKWEIGSDSSPDKTYVVSKADDGTWGCSCPRWTRMRHKLTDGECKHIKRVKVGEGWPVDTQPPEPPEIVLAMVKEVTLKDDGTVLTPLIPIGDMHFQVTMLYDLLRAGVPWSILKARYSLAKRNSRKAVVEYVHDRGRRIVLDFWPQGNATYTVVPCPQEDVL